MKAAVIDGVPDLSCLVDTLVYVTKPDHFPSVCCNAIKWIQKTRQVCEPKKMVCDAHFLLLNVHDSYNYNMN